MLPLIIGAVSTLGAAYLQSRNKNQSASSGGAAGTGQVNSKFQNDFSGWTVSTGSSKATGGARTEGAERMGGFDVPGAAGGGGVIVPSESSQLEKIAIGLAVGLGLASLMRGK
jgi:hypothetical protein